MTAPASRSGHGLAWLVVLFLAGCGGLPKSSSNAPSPAPIAAPVVQEDHRPLPVLPAAGSGRGGYYQDDGPGDHPPPGLLLTPNAEPKLEPYSPRANRPYVVFGQTYVPITELKPFKQRGVGSWYGKKFHGQRTSSGERYDMYKMTAAHPTLPIPSYARVTNLNNGAQVVVRINDRGPFHSSRIIDLSYTAALKLGYLGHGSSLLEVERLLPDEIARMTTGRSNPVEASPQTARPELAASAPQIPAELPPEAQAMSANGFYLQFGTYQQADNAQAQRQQLAQKWPSGLPPVELVDYGLFCRLYSGPFATRVEAAKAAQQVQEAGFPKPVLVQR